MYDQSGPTYTNSPTCRPGDKAKLKMDFRLSHVQPNNISVTVGVEASFYKIATVIGNNTNLCSFQSLDYLGQTDDDDNFRTPACPLRKGPYQVYTSFLVPDFNENDSESPEFTPDLELTFFDPVRQTVIGCVETGSLAMVSLGKRNGIRGQRFFIISMLGLSLTVAVCFVGHWRRRQGLAKAAAAKERRAMRRRFHYARSREQAVLMSVLNASTSEASTADPTPLHDPSQIQHPSPLHDTAPLHPEESYDPSQLHELSPPVHAPSPVHDQPPEHDPTPLHESPLPEVT